ncbi:hypothetical protein ACIBO4_05990 [Streptomyces sp. NPDC050149]|uniref:hypothetical protein n=1 Tax=Streptomyces sp. NPDC050149 TaxID=3365603 RepID=UPI00378A3EA5
MRQLSELTDVDDPAWPVLQDEFAGSSVPVDVLPGEGDPGFLGSLSSEGRA